MRQSTLHRARDALGVYARAHTHTHTARDTEVERRYMRAGTQAQTGCQALTQEDACTHRCARTRAHTCTHSHTRTRTRTHTHTNAHKRTRTRTHERTRAHTRRLMTLSSSRARCRMTRAHAAGWRHTRRRTLPSPCLAPLRQTGVLHTPQNGVAHAAG